MRNRLIVLGLGLIVGCAEGSTIDGGCEAGEIAESGQCVQLCTVDDACTTGICLDGVCRAGRRPVVSNHVPGADASDVEPDGRVVLSFSEAMEPTSTLTAFSLFGEDGPVIGEGAWNGANTILTFTPTELLTAGETYTVDLASSAASAVGISLARPFSFEFTVFLPAVVVQSMTPIPGSIEVGLNPAVTVTFSVPMALDSVLANVALIDAGTQNPASGQVTLDSTARIATFQTGSNLTYNTLYTLRVLAGTRSTAGATLTTTYEGSFTTTATPDLVPPVLTADPVAITISTPDLDVTESFTFTGDATDGETSIEKIEAQIVTAGSGPTGSWAPVQLNSATFSYRWFPTAGGAKPDGAYALFIRAFDKGGNMDEESLYFQADFQPPTVPAFLTPSALPATHKFPTMQITVTGEIESLVEVLINNAEIGGSPFDLGPSGISPTIGLTLSAGANNVAIFGVDDEGNRNPVPLTGSVNRTGYTCLTADNSFPYPGATSVAASFTDDLNGNVTISYYVLDNAGADAYIYSSTGGQDQFSTSLSGTSEAIIVRFLDELVPACAEVTSAKLRFRSGSNNDCACANLVAQPLKRPWNEVDADWVNATASVIWETAGAKGTTDVGVTQTGVSTSRLDIKPHLDQWVAFRRGVLTAQENFGLRLSSSSSVTIYSQEYGQNYAPILELSLREPEVDE